MKRNQSVHRVSNRKSSTRTRTNPGSVRFA